MTTLTSTTTQFSEAEINDALGSYLGIIGQCDQSTGTVSGQGNSEVNGTETLDGPPTTSKRALSPEPIPGTGKRQKPDELDFPWSIREDLSRPGLSDDL